MPSTLPCFPRRPPIARGDPYRRLDDVSKLITVKSKVVTTNTATNSLLPDSAELASGVAVHDVGVADGAEVSVAVGVNAKDAVQVAEGEGEAVALLVGVDEGDAVTVNVGSGVAVSVRIGVAVAVGSAVAVGGTGVSVDVGVSVGRGVAVSNRVAVGGGAGAPTPDRASPTEPILKLSAHPRMIKESSIPKHKSHRLR